MITPVPTDLMTVQGKGGCLQREAINNGRVSTEWKRMKERADVIHLSGMRWCRVHIQVDFHWRAVQTEKSTTRRRTPIHPSCVAALILFFSRLVRLSFFCWTSITPVVVGKGWAAAFSPLKGTTLSRDSVPFHPLPWQSSTLPPLAVVGTRPADP